MIEAENVINSRPLTVGNLSDHESPEPLTPNQLLRANVCKFRATGSHGQKLNFAHILSIHTY